MEFCARFPTEHKCFENLVEMINTFLWMFEDDDRFTERLITSNKVNF